MKVFLLSPSNLKKVLNHDPFNEYLSREIMRYLPPATKGSALLDLGCGAGRNSSLAVEKGYRVYAVDQNKKVLEAAKLFFIEKKLSDKVILLKEDATTWRDIKLKGYFDYVILQEVIEHIENDQKAIDAAFYYLKKGGSLLLSTPYDPSQWTVFDDHAGHLRRYTIGALREKLHDFKIHTLYTIGFPIHRLVHMTVSRIPRFNKNNEELSGLRMNPLWELYYQIFGCLYRIESILKTAKLGTTIIAVAQKE